MDANQIQLPKVDLVFSCAEDFVRIHEEGTVVEMDNEEAILQNFNDRRYEFDAWPIGPIPGTTTNFSKVWLVLVKVPPVREEMEFPAIGDHFTVDMVEGVKRGNNEYSLVRLAGERIPNPYEDIESVERGVRKSAAFKIDVPRS